MRLAIEAGCSWQTVHRWVEGLRVNPATRYALERACVVLGIVREPAAPEGTGGEAA